MPDNINNNLSPDANMGAPEQPNVAGGTSVPPANPIPATPQTDISPMMPVDNNMPQTPPIAPASSQPSDHLQSSNAFLDNLLGSTQPQGDISSNQTASAPETALPNAQMSPTSVEPTTPPPVNYLTPDAESLSQTLMAEQAPTTPEMSVKQTETATIPNIESNRSNVSKMDMPNAPKKSKAWIWVILIILVAAAVSYYFISLQSKNAANTISLTTSLSNASISTSSTSAINDSTRQNDLVNIQKALEQYYLSNNQKYPMSVSLCRTQDTSCILSSALVPTYLSAVPVDPATNNYYGYESQNGSSYALSAIFDTTPAGVESTQTSKGYLVILSPSVTLQSVTSTSSSSQ